MSDDMTGFEIEPEQSEENDASPFRGILLGLFLSSPIWLAIILRIVRN